MMEMTLLDRAAEVRERNAALKRTCQELRQIDAEWTTYAIAAEEAMRIADDGLRNAWNMLERWQSGRMHRIRNPVENRVFTGVRAW